MTEKEAYRNEKALESWKEIAAYLKRDVRTVKRWEKSEGLPVHRHLHRARSSVYAYASELHTWRTARQPAAEKADRLFWRPAPAAALGALLLLALLSAGSRSMRTAAAEQAAGQKPIGIRLLWSSAGIGFWGSPSPDGRFLTYVDWKTGDLAIRDLATGQNRRITNQGGFPRTSEFALTSVISPDGKQVVYAWSDKEGCRDLRLANLDGSGSRVLYRHDQIESVQPRGWSRDGKQILAWLQRKDKINQMAMISVVDGSARMVKTLDSRQGGRPSLSPDGRYIACGFSPKDGPGQSDIYVLAADASWEIPLVQHPAQDVVAGWAPDGRSILFLSDRTGTWDAWLLPVADGKPQGPPTRIRHNVGNVHPMGFTEKGAFFYGTSTSLSDVYIAPFDAATGQLLGPPKPATQHSVYAYSPAAWSRDGRSLAYIVQPGPYNIRTFVIRAVETGQERQLPKNFHRLFTHRVQWSADGTSLLAAGFDTPNRQAIFRVDVRTGDLTMLVERRAAGEYLSEPAWSPDGKAIFYRRSQPAKQPVVVVKRDLQTGEEKEVLREAGLGSWALSPDGQRLAFLGNTGKDFEYATALKVVPVAGGEARELFAVREPQFLSEVAWMPDGRHLMFFRGADRHEEVGVGGFLDMTKQLWRIPAEGGQAQRIDLPLKKLRFLAIHPDGRQIAFTAGEGVSTEVWVMENFLPVVKTGR